MKDEQILYVYGTLRQGAAETVSIPGVMYDMGWFPAVVDVVNTDHVAHYPHQFLAEKRVVTKEQLQQFDRYEGYREDDPDRSFYKRVRFQDGWIYQFNQGVDGHKVVKSGDWLEYVKTER